MWLDLVSGWCGRWRRGLAQRSRSFTLSLEMEEGFSLLCIPDGIGGRSTTCLLRTGRPLQPRMHNPGTGSSPAFRAHLVSLLRRMMIVCRWWPRCTGFRRASCCATGDGIALALSGALEVDILLHHRRHLSLPADRKNCLPTVLLCSRMPPPDDNCRTAPDSSTALLCAVWGEEKSH